MKKEAILQKFRTERVIALIRADNPDGLLDCAKALAEGGLTSIELTMTTPGAIRMLEKATSELPDFLFGLGTVLDAETARAGILSGAKFIVTPALRSRRRCREDFPRRILRPRLHQIRQSSAPAHRDGPHRWRE